MKLSRDKITRLSHLILQRLNQDDGVEFYADLPEIRQVIFHVIANEMRVDEAIDAFVRKKLESQKRQILEGSEEWDVLYRKYYEEETQKRRKVMPA